MFSFVFGSKLSVACCSETCKFESNVGLDCVVGTFKFETEAAVLGSESDINAISCVGCIHLIVDCD